MQVYRITETQYAEDLSGIGAQTAGGRWNRKGMPVVYAAENRALAALEKLVHFPVKIMPVERLSISTIHIPDDFPVPDVSELLDGKPLREAIPYWSKRESLLQTVRVGSKWVRSKLSIAFKTPSVVMPQEYNFVLNPRHPDFHNVRIIDVQPFQFDERLIAR